MEQGWVRPIPEPPVAVTRSPWQSPARRPMERGGLGLGLVQGCDPSGHRQALLEAPQAPCVVLGSLWEWQGWRVTRKWVESPGHSLGYIGVSLETLELVVRLPSPS